MAQLGGYFESSFTYQMPDSLGPFLPPARTFLWVTPPAGSTSCPANYPNCYAWMGWTTIDLAQYHWSSPDTPGPSAWAVRNGMARVPEPSVLALIGLGAAVALARRRPARSADSIPRSA